MLKSIVTLCVRHFGAVSALTLLALILGCWGALSAPLDVFPDFVPSEVDIQTEAPGLAPQQVEELVTKQVENAVNGTSGLATMRSESIPGLSVVTITFADNIDVHVARQGISERLSELGSTLPAGVGTPKLSPLVSSTMDLLKIGLLSDKVDAYELRDTADWIIKPRLLAVPGVAHVINFGGSVRQIQILPDVHKLAAYSLTMADVADAARTALPLRGAGFIDTPQQRILLQSPTPTPDLDTVKRAVITTRNGTPVLLEEVAQVKIAPALRSGDALIMGKPGVLVSLASQYGANTLSTTLEVEKALSDLEPALKARGITLYSRLHRPANFIEGALGNLQHSLLIAALLIVVVLFLFLRDWRAALIAFSAIPLSLLAAIAVLDHYGYTLNTMTLGGFAVALGVLVDDAIIGIENIMRRLRENGASPTPQPRLVVVRDASLEVRGPVIYATAVVIAVFLPGVVHLQRPGSFCRSSRLGLHFCRDRLAARGDDLHTRTVRAIAARTRRSRGGRLVEAPEILADGCGTRSRQTFQTDGGCPRRVGRRRHRGPSLRRRNLHAGLSRGALCNAGVELHSRSFPRSDDRGRQAHQRRRPRPALRRHHRATDRTGRVGRGHVGSASK